MKTVWLSPLLHEDRTLRIRQRRVRGLWHTRSGMVLGRCLCGWALLDYNRPICLLGNHMHLNHCIGLLVKHNVNGIGGLRRNVLGLRHRCHTAVVVSRACMGRNGLCSVTPDEVLEAGFGVISDVGNWIVHRHPIGMQHG